MAEIQLVLNLIASVSIPLLAFAYFMCLRIGQTLSAENKRLMAEVERLVAHASPMVGRIIRFLAATGMRQEEAVSLEWPQVSVERQKVHIT
jgi:integrase